MLLFRAQSIKAKGGAQKRQFTVFENRMGFPFLEVGSLPRSDHFVLFTLDCEESLIFFRFKEGSASKHQRRAAKPRVARNEGCRPRRKRDADNNLLNKFNRGIGDFLNFILAALELERDEVTCTHNNTLQCAMTCSLGMYCM